MSSNAVSRKVIIESFLRHSLRISTTQSMVGKNKASFIRQYHQVNGSIFKATGSRINHNSISKFMNLREFSDKSTDGDAEREEENKAPNHDSESSQEEGNGNEKDEGPSEIEKLEAQVKEMKDQLLRSYAEQENIRRIAKKDVDNAKAFAITSFAKSLLDTSDNLTRALDAVPEEYREDKENHAVLATLFEGIKMTDDGLTKAFAKNGLTKFGVVGDKFDPNMHEALFEYQDEKMEAGSIGQVMKVGFSLKERVIRPAEVGVVKSPNA